MYKTFQDDEEVTIRTPEEEQLTVRKTPFSILSEYTPSGFSQASDVSFTVKNPAANDQADATKDKVNSFLAARDMSPIHSTMVMPWDTAADKTKRQYCNPVKLSRSFLLLLRKLRPQVRRCFLKQ